MSSIDFRLFQLINQFAGKWHLVDGLMTDIAKAGPLLFVIPIIYLWFKKDAADKQAVILTGLSAALALVVNILIGHAYFRPRPFASHHVNLLLGKSPDASFPSDHATFSFAIASLIFLKDRRIGIPSIMLATMVSISRVFVGTHYPFDVLGGALIGSTTSVLLWRTRARLDAFTSLVIGIAQKIKLA